jgi:16S rRNA (guanine1516-N2)-methyltransferase
LIVTTSERPPDATIQLAIRLADELQGTYVARSNKTIRSMYAKYAVDELVIVSPQEVRLLSEGQPAFFFHPSMALVRLKRLMTGSKDTLLSVSGVTKGDIVLDCTAGLCSDSLVFSYAVGSEGRVIAMEASPQLHAIVREGLKLYHTGINEIDEAMRAIQPIRGHHEPLLRQMDDRSADVVYFDPMFERPVASSSNLVPLRSQAYREPLTEQSVQEAIRVARKKVILKDHRDSGQFERLGFSKVRVSSSAVAYGVITID